MKTLYAMRHAKSDWSGGGTDFDRPLNRRGLKDVPRMARLLASGDGPGALLASPARRARQTAEGLIAGLSGRRVDLEVTFEPRLYGADPDTLCAVAAGAPAAADSLLVVAHNPGMEDWVGLLTGARIHMPTAAIASIALDIPTWDSLPDASGQLQWLVTPKLLKAMGG